MYVTLLFVRVWLMNQPSITRVALCHKNVGDPCTTCSQYHCAVVYTNCMLNTSNLHAFPTSFFHLQLC